MDAHSHKHQARDGCSQEINRMAEPLTTQVFYYYDQHRCVLDIRYDPARNEVTITGGRHGYACLTEMFAIMAQLDETYTDSNWNDVRGDFYRFVIWLNDELRKE
jgi:hypothetical protein